MTAPLQAQSFEFDRDITQDEFSELSRVVGQAIFASPVEPARATSVVGFDLGIAATAVPVDTESPFWQAAGNLDLSIGDYLGVPRVVLSKGFGSFTIAASYASMPDIDGKVIGGSLDVPIINGGLVKPTLAIRGSYSQLSDIENFECKTYGAELFLSKGFGPVTPYVAVGRMRVDSEGLIPATGAIPVLVLTDESDIDRYTVGVRLSLFLPKLVVEATKADETVYSAKVSFGF